MSLNDYIHRHNHLHGRGLRAPHHARQCRQCRAAYWPKSGNAWYCDECRERRAIEKNRANVKQWRARKAAAMRDDEREAYREAERERLRRYRAKVKKG